MSSNHLSNVEKKELQVGLSYCYIYHFIHLKNLVATLEWVAQRNSNDIDHIQLEEFHESFRWYVNRSMEYGIRLEDKEL